MSDKSIKISVVVPVKNGMDTLGRFIEGIKLQTLFSHVEVIVVDSGSTDGSVVFLSKFDFVKVIAIDPKTFNHGATRNLAVKACQGEFVLMTVQDAWTTDPNLLERMSSHFADELVVGVCGHQIVPHFKGMNPHQWFRPQSEAEPKYISFVDNKFLKLSPKEQFNNCGWDNVIAMYRKSALFEFPFATTDFAEDVLWAKTALSNNYTIVYDHRNRVNHYHHHYPDYVFKRIFIELFSIYKHFKFHKDLSVPFKLYFKVLYRNIKWGLKPYWFFFNVRALMAKSRANKLFEDTLKEGDEHLEEVYLKVCGKIPQGKLNSKLSRE